jgi:hypothetical protein
MIHKLTTIAGLPHSVFEPLAELGRRNTDEGKELRPRLPPTLDVMTTAAVLFVLPPHFDVNQTGGDDGFVNLAAHVSLLRARVEDVDPVVTVGASRVFNNRHELLERRDRFPLLGV